MKHYIELTKSHISLDLRNSLGPKMSAYFYESKQTAGKMWMWDLENPTNGNGKNKGLVRIHNLLNNI